MIVMESGQVYSWGFNDYGQVGLGSKMDRQVLRALHGWGWGGGVNDLLMRSSKTNYERTTGELTI